MKIERTERKHRIVDGPYCCYDYTILLSYNNITYNNSFQMNIVVHQWVLNRRSAKILKSVDKNQ